MARRRYGRRRRSHGFKLPVISLAIVAGQALAAQSGSLAGAHNIGQMLDTFQSFYTGVSFQDRAFHPERLILGYAPWLVKRFVGAVARPRMPVHGLPISLS